MIGEIRDQETAEIAVKASITGHLVVSTLHTNSSANTITRLADMGVENYLIADSVVGVIAQRLVRRVCPACGIVREATAGEKKILGIKDPARRINVRTPGHKECVRCGGTGYYGRIGIYEIMPVTADLRQAINRGENADVLEEIALTHGMKTLRMSAIDYALRGITTVEEVQSVAYDDEEDYINQGREGSKTDGIVNVYASFDSKSASCVRLTYYRGGTAEVQDQRNTL